MNDNQATGFKYYLSKYLKLIIVIGLLVLIAIPIIEMMYILGLKGLFSYFADKVISTTGVNPYLAKAIVMILMIPLLWSFKWTFSFRSKRRMSSYAILAGYILLFYMSMFFMTKEQKFDFSTGEAMKFCAHTPEGVRCFDAPGFDPKYGIKLKPATPELIANMEKMNRGMLPQKLKYRSVEVVEFFDRLTGEAKVWYFQNQAGEYELFDSPGVHPTYGETLKPATKDVVNKIKSAIDVAEKNSEEMQALQDREQALQAREQEKKQAAQKRESFLNRYIGNLSFINKPSSVDVAVIVISDVGKTDPRVSQKISSQLKSKAVNASMSFFSDQFVADGLFERMFKGDAKVIKQLELAHHIDYAILGKNSISFAENPEMQNLITAKVVLEIHVISSKSGATEDSFSISEVGVGFSKSNAEEAALEKIYKKLGEGHWDRLKSGS